MTSTVAFLVVCLTILCYVSGNEEEPNVTLILGQKKSQIIEDNFKLIIVAVMDQVVEITDYTAKEHGGKTKIVFSFAGSKEEKIKLLKELKAKMSQQNYLNNNFSVENVTFSGIGGDTATTSTETSTSETTTATITTATATTTTVTEIDPAMFVFTVLLKSSTAKISEAAFKSNIANALDIQSSRVVFKDVVYFGEVYANVTATFTKSSKDTDKTPARLVGDLRLMMLGGDDSPGKTQLKSVYNIVLMDFYNYYVPPPFLPWITIYVNVTYPNVSSFSSAIAQAVGVSVTRVSTPVLRLVKSGVWNYTFQFTAAADGEVSSLTLAKELQLAFFEEGTAYTSFLAPLKSNYQEFEKLPTLVASTTTTTAEPIPNIRAVLKILLTSPESKLNIDAFKRNLASLTENPVDAASRVRIFSTEYKPQDLYVIVTVTFTDNTTESPTSTEELLTQVWKQLTSDPATTGRITFNGIYPIQKQEFFGYIPIPPFQPSISVVFKSNTPSVSEIISAVAGAVAVPVNRVVTTTLEKVDDGLWNYTFRFAPGSPSSVTLAKTLQQVFYYKDEPAYKKYLAPMQFVSQSYESLPPYTPTINPVCWWIVQRGSRIQELDFIYSVTSALSIPQTRMVVHSNDFTGVNSNISFEFPETESSAGTADSRYNLSYTLMKMMFEKQGEAYESFLASYDVVDQYYGSDVVILTTPAPSDVPIILFTMDVKTFSVDSFKGNLAAALHTGKSRIDTVKFSKGEDYYNFSFMFNNIGADNSMTAAQLSKFLQGLFYWKLDPQYYTYIVPMNITYIDWGHITPVEIPVIPIITISLRLKREIIGYKEDGNGVNTTVYKYYPQNMTTFVKDFAALAGSPLNRLQLATPPYEESEEGAVITITMRFSPVADPTSPTSIDLATRLQWNLANREGPNINHIYNIYDIIAKTFSDIPFIPDAAPTTTRNPLLPSLPSFFNPVGNRTASDGNDSVVVELDEDDDNTIIYGVVFGVIGAVLLVVGSIVIVKCVMDKKNQGPAKKYAQV